MVKLVARLALKQKIIVKKSGLITLYIRNFCQGQMVRYTVFQNWNLMVTSHSWPLNLRQRNKWGSTVYVRFMGLASVMPNLPATSPYQSASWVIQFLIKKLFNFCGSILSNVIFSSPDSKEDCYWLSVFSISISFSLRRRILPTALLGSSSINSMILGTL